MDCLGYKLEQSLQISLRLVGIERIGGQNCGGGDNLAQSDKEGAFAGYRAVESAKLGTMESINPKQGISVESYFNLHHCLHIQILLTESLF